MVLSCFLTSRGYFHRGRLRAEVAAPHPVSEITVRQSFSKNQGGRTARREAAQGMSKDRRRANGT